MLTKARQAAQGQRLWVCGCGRAEGYEYEGLMVLEYSTQGLVYKGLKVCGFVDPGAMGLKHWESVELRSLRV